MSVLLVKNALEYDQWSMLGTMRCVSLRGKETETRTVHWEWNAIDGWSKRTDHHADGIVTDYDTTRLATVAEVLDARPDALQYVVRVHASWLRALKSSHQPARAGAQRRSLDAALGKRGLRLAT